MTENERIVFNAKKDARFGCEKAVAEHCKQVIGSSADRLERLVGEIDTFVSERFESDTLKKIRHLFSESYGEIGKIKGKSEFL